MTIRKRIIESRRAWAAIMAGSAGVIAFIDPLTSIDVAAGVGFLDVIVTKALNVGMGLLGIGSAASSLRSLFKPDAQGTEPVAPKESGPDPA